MVIEEFYQLVVDTPSMHFNRITLIIFYNYYRALLAASIKQVRYNFIDRIHCVHGITNCGVSYGKRYHEVSLIVLRHAEDSLVLLKDAIYVLAVSTILAYVRLMHVFSFSPTLVSTFFFFIYTQPHQGPLYFVIVRLIWNVLEWLFIFIVFCVSFQVTLVIYLQ